MPEDRLPGLRRLIWFILAGVSGFLVDTGVLYAVIGTLGLIAGRFLSFLCALTVTWLINRSATFADRDSGYSLAGEFVRYAALMAVGGAVNLGAYTLTVLLLPLAARYPVLGVATGSLAGMVVNYVNLQLLMFRRRSRN